MEESTEAHMETDVSSTTEDVPETQEVTGSNGNIDMIIIVESVKEEDINSNVQNENQPSAVNGNTIEEQPSPGDGSTNEAPQADTRKQKTPTQSPTKDVEQMELSPSKPEVIQKVVNKDLQPDSEIELSAEVQQSDNVDSSMKDPPQVESIDTPKSVHNSPKKIQKISPGNSPKKEVPKSLQMSPIQQIQMSSQNSPKKVVPIQISTTEKNLEISSDNCPEKVLPKPIQISTTEKKQEISPENSSKTEVPKPVLIATTDLNQKMSLDSPKKVVPKPVEMSTTENNQTMSAENSPKKIVPKEDLLKSQLPRSTPTKESLLVERFKIQSNENSNDSSMNIKTIVPINTTIEREMSNDSQLLEVNSVEINGSETSEKEHKSISRELKSLIKSAKDSKIISECTQLTSKTRKSRTGLDSSSTSLNTSIEPDKIQNNRRTSNNSQKSNCSEKSEKVAVKRSMRSQNPEFVSKVKQFLNSVTGKGQKGSDDEDDEIEDKINKDKTMKDKKEDSLSLTPLPPKIRKVEAIMIDKSGKLRLDPYCWRCHWAVEQGSNEKVHPPIHCTVCPRFYHYKCLSTNERNKITTEKSWVCPECMIVLQAESPETRSPAMKKISLSMLCDLLKHAMERMMDLNGVEPFMQPVDRTAFPDYDKYVVHPMDLSLMRNNINAGLYASTEAFVSDAQWILHNSIIFNTLQSKLTAGARALVRGCRAEMGEIEACPECYAAAHAHRPTWFTDVCTTPHILLWAKLKGFPYWPAKGMSVSSAGHVDVRFFGAHDRAWVPAKDCFLYSEKDPNNFRTKRQDIIDSMQEAEEHIRNISRKYGKFVYPPFKTQFDPTKLNEQLKMIIPTFEGEVGAPIKAKSNASPSTNKKRRSNSKSSKSSYNDGDMSESEDTHDGEQPTRVPSRKMADGADIAREEEEPIDIETDMDMDTVTSNKASDPGPDIIIRTLTPLQYNNEITRRRRYSNLEEATLTIMEPSHEPKRRKTESKSNKEKKKVDEQEPSSSKEVKEKRTPAKVKNGPVEKDKKDETNTTDNEPSSSTRLDAEKEKNLRVTPIRIALVQKDKQHNLRTSSNKEPTAKIITPIKDKEKDNDKTHLRSKSSRTEKAEKSSEKTPKEDKLKETSRSEKRRNSRNNRSLTSTPKSDKPRSVSLENKSEKTSETSSSKDKTKEITKESKDKTKEITKESKDKTKENRDKAKDCTTSKEKEPDPENVKREKNYSPKPTSANSSKSAKDRNHFDDNTSLAVLARETNPIVISHNTPGMPTISSVRSLSTTAPTVDLSVTSNTTMVTNEANLIIISPESTEATTNAKDAAFQLQRLRKDAEPMVGRVGVRAFARLSSSERSPKRNDDVHVEIKAEPIDVDDADRQIEKLNLMNAFKLRPVVSTPQQNTSNLRDVRINKMVVTPLNTKKTANKSVEVKAKAKKSFPQPKKLDDGQLNSKNSMVYIPIQPPVTQAPVRPPRVVAGPTAQTVVRPPLSLSATTNQSLVNTVTTPVMQVSSMMSSPLSATSSASPPGTSGKVTALAGVGGLGGVSGVNALSASVHTVPLMTSVNGQWMFSFQPVMSVGAIDSSPSPPIVNGVAERSNNSAPTASAPAQHNPVLAVTAGPSNSSVPPPMPRPIVNKTPGDNHAPGEPPRLQQRPPTLLLNPLDASTPVGLMPTPSSAGPVTAKLNQNAVKLTDFFRTLIEDSLEKLDEPGTLLTKLRLQLEQARWRHQTEVKEMKHNHDLTLAEMRALFEKDKLRAVADARRSAQLELEAAVKAAKCKQWCANCSQEAQFYCCWNTSYCDYPCQRAHWSQHFNVCTQQRQDGSNNGEPPAPPEHRLQPQPDHLPVLQKNSSTPALTVGGKLAPSRVYTQDPNNSNPQKNAIIVSLVEDKSGNQTMKCLGTYKPTTPAQPNMSPIIINKQIMHNEENANKNLVSSGGYLIVGGGTNNAAVVTPAKRHMLYTTIPDGGVLPTRLT